MLVIILQGRQSCAPFNLKPSSRYYATCTRTALGTGAPEPPSRGRTRIAVADAVLRRTSHGAEEYRFACGRRGVCLVATCRVAHELAGVVLRRTLFRSYELFADAVHNLAANTPYVYCASAVIAPVGKDRNQGEQSHVRATID